MPRGAPSVATAYSLQPTAFRAGFTLLEILVVIVIIGVLISVTTISVGVMGRDREMQDQAERLWAVLQQAKEESELQGFDLGLRVGAQSYDFLRFDARQQSWLPVFEDDLLAARDLPDGLRLRLWLEGREAILTERPGGQPSLSDAAGDAANGTAKKPEAGKEPDKKKELPPQVLVLSSGDINAFDLHVEREGSDARWHVFAKPDSTLVVEELREPI